MEQASPAARPAVVIVGAGPTGLTLALELQAAAVPFRIIDVAPSPVHESRALAIQARTLEVLDRLGVTDALVAAGNRATSIAMHARGRTVPVALFDEANDETPYPFLLFLSQARTEEILLNRLEGLGVQVERGQRLIEMQQDADGVTFVTDGAAGRATGTAGYVVGCDGAHSAVRTQSGIPFSGTSFPQTFAIADVEVDELERGRVHAFIAGRGILFFFPLGTPTTWRLLGMLPRTPATQLDLEQVQATVDDYVAEAGRGPLTLRDAVWLTTFTIQSRGAEVVRAGRVFLAGDAAHIHSPAGAQGMNTGIQDAINLGWKLAQVHHGLATPELLDTYGEERIPIAREVIRMSNRLFRLATSPGRLLSFVRPRVAPVGMGVLSRSRLVRRLAFRTVSEIALGYRGSALARLDDPRGRGALRAGDRLPDVDVMVAGRRVNLRRMLTTPGHLLVVFGAAAHDRSAWKDLGPLVGKVIFVDGSHTTAARRFGFTTKGPSSVLLRPDGYVACRSEGTDQRALRSFLSRWTSGASAPSAGTARPRR